MKTILTLLLLCLLLASCEREGTFTSDDLLVDEISPGSVLKYQGFFIPTSGINVTGGVHIYQNPSGFELRLDNFTISDGPDLKVYLSKTDSPTAFINLGNLADTIYAFPAQINMSDYGYVLIHCQQYNHLFAICKIEKL